MKDNKITRGRWRPRKTILKNLKINESNQNMIYIKYYDVIWPYNQPHSLEKSLVVVLSISCVNIFYPIYHTQINLFDFALFIYPLFIIVHLW